MTTAGERMLELSPLPSGHTAREHFLAITQTGGGFIVTEVDKKVSIKNTSNSVVVWHKK